MLVQAEFGAEIGGQERDWERRLGQCQGEGWGGIRGGLRARHEALPRRVGTKFLLGTLFGDSWVEQRSGSGLERNRGRG